MRVIRTHDLRDVVGVEGCVARIFAFGRERQEHVLADLLLGGLQKGLHLFAGHTGPNGGFDHHQRAGFQMRREAFDGGQDDRGVGRAVIAKGRRHTDQHNVLIRNPRGVRGRLIAPRADRVRNPVFGEIGQHLFACVDPRDAGLIKLKTRHAEPGLAHAH